MSNLPSRPEASTTASAQETTFPSAALTVASPSALLDPHIQLTQQQLSTFASFGTKPSKFSTVEEALQSIIPEIEQRTRNDSKVKPSNKEPRTPACCIHSLLFSTTTGLSPEQRDELLKGSLYTADRLYANSSLSEVLQTFYTREDWNNYWRDRRGRYLKQFRQQDVLNVNHSNYFLHHHPQRPHIGHISYTTLPSSNSTQLPLQLHQHNTNITSITNHQHVTNTANTNEIIEAINQRADVSDSNTNLVVLTTERNLAKQLEDTARKNHHSPSSYRSPIQAGKKLFSNDTQDTCSINADYFKTKFEKVQGATATDANFDHWTKILRKKGIVELDQFYPANVLICPSPTMLEESILADDITRFLTQNRVLVSGEGTEEVVVFNAAEFASNKKFVKAILGALSFTFSSSVFVVTKGDDGEMHRCELTIRGKTTKSIGQVADLLYTVIIKMVGSESDCVGIVDPEYFEIMFRELKIKENFEQHLLNDRYQVEGVDTHLQDQDGIKLPPAIIKCSNPLIIVSEHIKLDTKSIFNQKVLIDGDAFVFAFTDDVKSLDQDCVIERLGRLFGKPMGFYVQAVQCNSSFGISFLINAPDALSGGKLLTCVSSCLATVGPDVITDVTFENVHDSLCPLPLGIENFKSLVRRANNTPIEFLRFTITNDIQDAMACATAPLIFVDCCFEE